jgi:hemerythrin-like metal-binding protein
MSMKIPFEQIEWLDGMATGVAAIDNQHRYLVDTLREANERLLDSSDAALLAEIARDLLSYAIMHFETEEELMQRYGYHDACPEVARLHVAQHREFSRQVVAVRDSLHEGRQVSRIDVLRYLNEWLRNHVLGIDQQLGDFVRQAQAREAASQAA